MIKYKTSACRSTIDAVEVVKETDKFVVLASNNAFGHGTRREAKVSDYCAYFDSWADAHKYHVDRVSKEIASAERKLSQLNNELAQINDMKDPTI